MQEAVSLARPAHRGDELARGAGRRRQRYKGVWAVQRCMGGTRGMGGTGPVMNSFIIRGGTKHVSAAVQYMHAVRPPQGASAIAVQEILAMSARQAEEAASSDNRKPYGARQALQPKPQTPTYAPLNPNRRP